MPSQGVSTILSSARSKSSSDLTSMGKTSRPSPPSARLFSSMTRCIVCWSFAFTNKATPAFRGKASFNSSSRFVLSSTAICVNPVMLPPGLAKLLTRFERTGSGTRTNTIGMVLVAFCAAKAAGSVTTTAAGASWPVLARAQRRAKTIGISLIESARFP